MQRYEKHLGSATDKNTSLTQNSDFQTTSKVGNKAKKPRISVT